MDYIIVLVFILCILFISRIPQGITNIFGLIGKFVALSGRFLGWIIGIILLMSIVIYLITSLF